MAEAVLLSLCCSHRVMLGRTRFHTAVLFGESCEKLKNSCSNFHIQIDTSVREAKHSRQPAAFPLLVASNEPSCVLTLVLMCVCVYCPWMPL